MIAPNEKVFYLDILDLLLFAFGIIGVLGSVANHCWGLVAGFSLAIVATVAHIWTRKEED